MAETNFRRKRPHLDSDLADPDNVRSDGEEDEEEYLVPSKRHRSDLKTRGEFGSRCVVVQSLVVALSF